MMHIRPSDLPILRDELVAYLVSGHYREKLLEAQIHLHPILGHLPVNEFARMEANFVHHADLYIASDEMTALADAAAVTLPDFGFQPEGLPSKQGFLVFVGELRPVPHGDPPLPYVVVGYVWVEIAGFGVLLHPFAERDAVLASLHRAGIATQLDVDHSRRVMPRIIPMVNHATWIPYGATGGDERSVALLPASKTLRSAWLLMQQPVASVSDAAYDRAARRRLQRQGQEPPQVRVITLRRPANPNGSGQSDREYHHQWIVRGHWRIQPWGPNRERRRPVWIAPHVKGPEGAPMLGGEKVYSWTR